MSWSYWFHQLRSLPYNVWLLILGMAGLAVQPRQIVRIVPDHPGVLQLRASEGEAKEGDDVPKEVSVTEWIWKNVPSLKGTFTPSWWLPNGHLQTVYSVFGDFTKVDPVEYKRTYLRVPDGGTLALDFAPVEYDTLPSSTPIMVVCHGLTGGSHESYVRNVLAWATKADGGLGVRAVVVNFRGCAGTPLTSPQMYSAGTTIDLATSLHYLRHTFPDAPLHGIGFSLGASVLARYLGESGSHSLLSSGIVLGCPWNLPDMSDMLENHWFRRTTYSDAMGQNLLRLFFSHYEKRPDLFKGPIEECLPELERLRKQRRVRLKDVDDYMVAKMGGPQRPGMWPFKDADAYYEWARADRWIKGVKRPLLSINAFDDPIINGASLPISEFTASSYVVEAVSGSGGHLGWFDGPFGSKSRWILQPIQDMWTAAVRDLGVEGGKVETRSGSPPSTRTSTMDFTASSKDGEATVDEEWIKVGQAGSDRWQWVDHPAHDPGQPIGWMVLEKSEIVEGGEESGVLQGL